MTNPPDSRLTAALRAQRNLGADACRGLAYRESACLAGLLLTSRQPLKHPVPIEGIAGNALNRALTRVVRSPEVEPRELGRTILKRLQGARRASLELLHPSWITRLRQIEPASVVSIVTGTEPEPGDPPSFRWIQDEVARRSGLFDPRHLHERRAGRYLEPGALRLASVAELERLARHLGLATTGAVFKSAGKRTLALMVRKLGLTIGQEMMDALLKAPPCPDGSVRLAGRIMSVLGKQPHLDLLQQSTRTGLYMLTVATSFRGSGEITGLAHAFPLEIGELMLSYRTRILTRGHAQTMHAPLAAWVLQSLQYLAAQGQTETPYHTQQILLAPPDEPLEPSQPKAEAP